MSIRFILFIFLFSIGLTWIIIFLIRWLNKPVELLENKENITKKNWDNYFEGKIKK